MVSYEEAEKIYREVTADYKTSMYTQEDLAQKYNISVEAVRACTQYLGFWHGKAKNGTAPVYFGEFIEKLRVML